MLRFLQHPRATWGLGLWEPHDHGNSKSVRLTQGREQNAAKVAKTIKEECSSLKMTHCYAKLEVLVSGYFEIAATFFLASKMALPKP